MALDAAGTCDPAGPTERAACEASAGGSGAFTLDLTGEPRARARCCFVTPLIHFIPELLAYSVRLLLKRQCDRTPGELGLAAAAAALLEVRAGAGLETLKPHANPKTVVYVGPVYPTLDNCYSVPFHAAKRLEPCGPPSRERLAVSIQAPGSKFLDRVMGSL